MSSPLMPAYWGGDSSARLTMLLPPKPSKTLSLHAHAVAADDPPAPPLHATGTRFKLLRRLSLNVRATNDMVLIQRLVNAEIGGTRHAFSDPLSASLRDVRQPIRACVYAIAPWAWRVYKRVVDAIAPGCCNYFDARARWLDAVVEAGLSAGATSVVLLAAGFDTRAHRVAGREKAAWFELDLPHVSAEKRESIACVLLTGTVDRVHYVPSNLLDAPAARAALMAAGWDHQCAATRTLVTLEGILMYLPPAKASAALATAVSLLPRSGRLAFDFVADDCVMSGGGAEWPGYDRVARLLADKKEPLLSGMPHDAYAHAHLAKAHGCRVVDLLAPPDIAARFFDDATAPVFAAGFFAVWERV